jgi:16S rRNA (cytidine1402-2'-O)-methyltransferase
MPIKRSPQAAMMTSKQCANVAVGASVNQRIAVARRLQVSQQPDDHSGAGLSSGVLYVVGTPLGNLEDITLRAQRILAEVDLVAAEDTRRTGRLLEHLGCRKPIISYYQHNERARTEDLVARIRKGESVALVTDAGMPGISDPGHVLISAALANGVSVVPVPGATAAATALVISGLPTDRFVFEGFLPRAGKERRERLSALATEERTIVLYEAPHRLLRTLADVHTNMGDRLAAVARELTKLHEECVRGSLTDLIAHFNERAPKGECVLIVGGRTVGVSDQVSAETMAPESKVKELLFAAIEDGLSRKDAVKRVVDQTGLGHREVYQASLALSDENIT